ncbi:thiamine pyrophosphate-binding protein [Mycobacterium sp.]|uniref:thiamine pyrophosphate-binding protein n=1 Tax=Mycobacterium sp. TaxID=1785 RepID=UPI002B6F72FC|nr:thiamine pyrophosphate-binding protein [Mycobacterium sp.]HXB90181.1 thiamine pyrophosphate-binding protein [Mycobacterium sp.]
MPRSQRVVDHIVEHLARIDIRYIFGVDGANIEDLYDAAHFRSDITAVLAKHEFSAATMADGYSRSGAGLGVVAATSGGGALNLVAGLGESLASRVPVLALVGQTATTMDGRGSFQDTSGRNGSLNAEALFSAVSVFCRRVLTPADIVSALPDAIAAARTGGPAVLLLPKDIQQSMVSLNGYDKRNGRGVDPQRSRIGDPHPIVRALRRANGPVTIIAGEQVARDDARGQLEELRALLRAQVACVPDAKDVAGIPGLGSSSALGVTGVMGHPGVADAVAESAVCLVVGTRLSVTARTGLDDALASVPTFSIGSAPPYLPCTHVHTEDLRGSLTMLTRALSGPGRPRGLRVPDFVADAELSPPAFAGTGVRYRDAMNVLDRVLPDGADIVVDAGNTGAAAIHYLPVRRDGRFAVALGMGGMGYSFGAGIGMAFGRANDGSSRRTVVIAGDGAFFMHGMEVHTAVQYRLPVTFVLFNNNAHAMCVTREQLFYDDLYSYNRFAPSQLGAGLAGMFPGLSSVDVADIDALPAALERAMAVDGPSVVTVECSADEIPPFAAFLNRQSANQVVEQQITTLKENYTHVPARA